MRKVSLASFNPHFIYLLILFRLVDTNL